MLKLRYVCEIKKRKKTLLQYERFRLCLMKTSFTVPVVAVFLFMLSYVAADVYFHQNMLN